MTPAYATRLDEALARMTWSVEPGRFALLGFAAQPTPEDLAQVGQGPASVVREGGETTLLLAENALADVLSRHPDARVERGLCWVRFETPMAWELVGFLALVCGRLAEAGVPVGAVCGYSRDHLFLAEPHLARARAVLAELFGEATP